MIKSIVRQFRARIALKASRESKQTSYSGCQNLSASLVLGTEGVPECRGRFWGACNGQGASCSAAARYQAQPGHQGGAVGLLNGFQAEPGAPRCHAPAQPQAAHRRIQAATARCNPFLPIFTTGTDTTHLLSLLVDLNSDGVSCLGHSASGAVLVSRLQCMSGKANEIMVDLAVGRLDTTKVSDHGELRRSRNGTCEGPDAVPA